MHHWQSRIAQMPRRNRCRSNAFLRLSASPREKPSAASRAADRERTEQHEDSCPPIQLIPPAEVERCANAAEEHRADHDRERFRNPTDGPPEPDVADREKNGRRAEHPESDSHRRQTL